MHDDPHSGGRRARWPIRIGVISGGCLIAEGTLEELQRRAGSTRATLEDTFLALVEADAARETVAA